MNDQPAAAEPTPLLQILRNFLARGAETLGRPKVSRDAAALWVASARSHLEKIYGKDAPALASLAKLPMDLTHEDSRKMLALRMNHVQRIVDALASLPAATAQESADRVFLGHGRSPVWRELKDFLVDRLRLACDEFNREPVAGLTTSERLDVMLSRARFAFLVMTAEEDHADATRHARPNVIHEVGLFQGRLGRGRAIVLLEEGCAEFSNIVGLSHVRFPRGNIAATFEEIRRVLERESVVPHHP